LLGEKQEVERFLLAKDIKKKKVSGSFKEVARNLLNRGVCK